jgi:hypothetical protein
MPSYGNSSKVKHFIDPHWAANIAALKVVANEVYTAKLETKTTWEGRRERATSADDCRRVSVGVSVQQYSVQCKGYNLIGVTTVETSETRGMTALVYLLHSSLYTDTVHVLSSVAGVHPTGLTADQGCRQVSTNYW